MIKNKITKNQYMFTLMSAMIGVGILAMTSGLSKTAHQQGWISVFIAGLYPAFIILTATIIDKKTNHASFWDINNMIYGKFLSYIFTLIFALYFLLIFVTITAGFTNVLRQTIAIFLSPINIILPIVILIPIISIRGVFMVGRICEFYFYATIPLLILPLFLITRGAIINVMPIFSSLEDIIKATPAGFYAFTGCEISYLIISKISNKKNILRVGIISVLITTLVYGSLAFIIIYFMGWELASMLDYPLMFLIESFEVPILSNFLAIFIFLWIAIILKSLVVFSFCTNYLVSKVIRIDIKKINIIFSLIALGCIYLFIPEFNRKAILDLILPYFIFFFLTWGFITSFIVSIKFKGGKL